MLGGSVRFGMWGKLVEAAGIPGLCGDDPEGLAVYQRARVPDETDNLGLSTTKQTKLEYRKRTHESWVTLHRVQIMNGRKAPQTRPLQQSEAKKASQ